MIYIKKNISKLYHKPRVASPVCHTPYFSCRTAKPNEKKRVNRTRKKKSQVLKLTAAAQRHHEGFSNGRLPFDFCHHYLCFCMFLDGYWSCLLGLSPCTRLEEYVL